MTFFESHRPLILSSVRHKTGSLIILLLEMKPTGNSALLPQKSQYNALPVIQDKRRRKKPTSKIILHMKYTHLELLF